MSFQTDKQAVFNLVRAQNCPDLKSVAGTTDYPQLAELLFSFADKWSCMKDYLEDLLSVFTSTQLGDYKVLFNTTAATVNNYEFVAKSNITTAINIDADADTLIIAASTVERVVISSESVVDSIYIIAGSKVKFIEIQPGSKVNYLLVRSCNGDATELTSYSGNLVYKGQEPGAILGARSCPTDANTVEF